MIRTVLIALLTLSFSEVASSQWHQLREPLGGDVYSFYKDSTSIYAAAGRYGVYRSLDGGEHWATTSIGIDADVFQNFIIVDSSLFVTAYDASVPLGAIFKRSSASWKPIFSLGISPFFVRLCGEQGVLYVLAGYDFGPTYEVFRSTDEGNTWNIARDSLSAFPSGESTDLLAFGGQFFLATSTGLYSSESQGREWKPIAELTAHVVTRVLVDQGRILAFTRESILYESKDTGRSWSVISETVPFKNVTELQQRKGELYAGTESGVFQSVDEGRSWSAVGLLGISIASLIQVSDRFLAGSVGHGVWGSDSTGMQWHHSGLICGSADHLAAIGNALFVSKAYADGYGHIDRSTDEGETWTSITDSTPVAASLFYPVSFLTNIGSELFAGGVNRYSVMHSANLGESWAPPSYGLSSFITSLVEHDGLLYCAGNKHVFRSVDHDRSWTSCDRDIYRETMRNTRMSLLSSGRRLLVGVSDTGMFYSDDGGDHWTLSNDGLDDFHISAVAACGQDIFAGTLQGKLYRSSDNGESWHMLPTNLDSGAEVTCIRAITNEIVVGTLGRGMIVSNDGGQSWKFANEDLSDLRINDVLISGKFLYCASATSGVWSRRLDEVLSVQHLDDSGVFSFFPNPLRDRGTIEWTGKEGMFAELVLRDVLGRRDALVFSGIMRPHEPLVLNAQDLPSGIYLLQIAKGEEVSVVRMVIER